MKLREHTAIVSKSDAFRVDPRRLEVDPGFNVRNLDAPQAREELDELKASIRDEGVQVALEIRMVDDRLVIVSGHRRHKVVMELIDEGHDLETIPAVAEPRMINDAERTARLITLNSGSPLSMLEKAEVVRRLLGFGWPREKIQQRFGHKSVQTVANYELLLQAPESLRDAVANGEIAASEAIAMVREHGTGVNTTEALKRARVVTRSSGKKRITRQVLDQPNVAPPAAATKPRYGAMLDQALNLLADVAANGYGARTMAESYIAQEPAIVASIVDWLAMFDDALRSRQ